MSTWGSHLLRHLSRLSPALLAGCAPAPQPVAPQPPPTPAPTAPAPPPAPTLKPDPPGASPGLTDFRPFLQAPASTPLALGSEQILLTPRGALAVGTLFAPFLRRCVVPGADPSCSFLRTAARTPTGKEPLASAPLGPWSAPRPAPASWTSLSSGRDVVYAIHGTSGLVIDAINDKGDITPVLAAPTYTPEIVDTRIVELPQGLVVIGTESDENLLTLVPIPRGDGGKLTPREATRTTISMLPAGATAAWARERISSRRKVGYGLWATAPALDAKGEPDASFYLAWTEVIPPAKYTPAGVSPRRAAKHGCGRSSRSLSDLSVDKIVHVTRYSDTGKRLDESLLRDVTFPPDDESLPLTITASAAGYTLNGVARDRRGQALRGATAEPAVAPPPDASAPLIIPPLQQLQAAQYDQKRGEGLLLLSENKRPMALRFDATGDLLGDPLPLPEAVPLSPTPGSSALAAAGSAWGALAHSLTSVHVLTGPAAGQQVALTSEQSWALTGDHAWAVPLDDESIEVVRYIPLPASLRTSLGLDDISSEHPLSIPLVARVNLHRAEATPWQPVEGWYGDEKKPRLAEVFWVGRGAAGQLLFVGAQDAQHAELHALDHHTWARPVPLGEGLRVGRNLLSFHQVWKDTTVAFHDGSGLLSWLGQGLTAQPASRVQARLTDPTGPLLAGERVLGPTASEPIKVEAVTRAKGAEACPAAFATGPRRLVLLCMEPPDEKTAGLRVGTRVLRF